ncbi:RibD family protein [Streptomyces profundus]|uniref:RibD family protein n=1 Tax=Streptomyces profundus TaxID=2867410 RepID=UPI002240F7A1|nr:RibD family protein [Streptomyces sp. MA3_2.13]
MERPDPREAGPSRPWVLLSCAASLDGFIDDATDRRLILSHAADLDRVDAERAASDAILVGAGTVRADNPRLLVRAAERRAARVAAGRPADPLRVVLTTGGRLDPAARIFTEGERPPLVYCPPARAAATAARLGEAATVIPAGDPLHPREIVADLARRGVRRLMVEGGGAIHGAFLAADLVDELQLVIAPFLLGTTGAARFPRPAAFPQGPARPMRLAEARPMGDHVLLRYLPDAQDGRD